jgi:xylulokinase
MGKKYVCGIDNGTTGTKAMIFDLEGNVVGSAYREYKCEYPNPGWVDQDANELFDELCYAVKAAVQDSGVDNEDIISVGLSTQRCTMVPVDNSGKPIRKAISWQDRRPTEECDWIREEFGAERYYDITGLPVDTTWALPAIMWIRNNEKEIYDKTDKFLLTQEYILHRLGAESYPEDWSNGSLYGLMDIEEFEWSEELLEATNISRDKLPELVPSAKKVGKVNKEAAILTGLAEGTFLVTGGGDQQCAGVGAGVIKEGLAEVTLGTAGVSLCSMDDPNKDPDGVMPCSAHAVPGKWECEGLQMAAGASLKWYRDNFADLEKLMAERVDMDPYEFINIELDKVPAGSDGLIFLPHLAGAGAPIWNPVAKGVLFGLTLSHTRNSIARAIMEGVTMETRQILESFEDLDLELKEVRITGGATKSKIWNQMQANIYGMPVVPLAVGEATVLGAALLGAVGSELFADIESAVESMVRTEGIFEPEPEIHEHYNKVFELYKGIYNSLAEGNSYQNMADVLS